MSLAGDGPRRRLTVRDVLFRTPESEWLTETSLPQAPLRMWNLKESGIDTRVVAPALPVLYGAEPYVATSDEGVDLGLDVFGGVFFCLTRYEEVANPERDERDRFPAHASLAARKGFLDRPLVNEYVEVLWWTLTTLWPRLERRERAFRELPSHDVDIPRCAKTSFLATLDTAVRDVAFRRDPRLAAARLLGYPAARAGKTERDPCNTFDLLMDLSEARGLRSAFYFIAGHTGGAIDGDYSVEEPPLRRLLRRVHERGHEIGLHTSYNTFRDAAQTHAELARLRRVCEEEGVSQGTWGGRQHFLRWENPATWQNWEDAGLDYDSTLTFAEQAGFRCGVCYEYPVFNLRTRRPLRLRERPLVAMDASLVRYGGLSPDETVSQIAELRRRCRLFDGDFTLLWHNDWLFSRRGKRLYERALGPA